jgi:hypothetical protein
MGAIFDCFFAVVVVAVGVLLGVSVSSFFVKQAHHKQFISIRTKCFSIGYWSFVVRESG